MNYNKDMFGWYVYHIRLELKKRNIKYQEKYFSEILEFCNDSECREFYPEHNNKYLKQCYYNLQEKYDRGIITDDEFNKILEVINFEW